MLIDDFHNSFMSISRRNFLGSSAEASRGCVRRGGGVDDRLVEEVDRDDEPDEERDDLVPDRERRAGLLLLAGGDLDLGGEVREWPVGGVLDRRAA